MTIIKDRLENVFSIEVILALALVVRVGAYYLSPNINYADEIYQYIEPAYSFYSKNTIWAWEYRAGLRNWLWPSILALAIWPAETFFGTLFALKFSIVFFCSLLSLIAVFGAYKIGCLVDKRAGLLTAFTTAFCSDFIYFSPHPLTEIVANNFIIMAIYFAIKPPQNNAKPFYKHPIFYCGLMLAITFTLRIHLTPALGLIGIFALANHKYRTFPTLLLGGVIPIICYGIADYIAYGIPFRTIYINFYVNIIKDVSSQFGIEPFYFYFTSDPFLIILFLSSVYYILLKSKINNNFNLLFYTSLVIMIIHSTISHKELRFIYSSYALIVIFLTVVFIKNFEIKNKYQTIIFCSVFLILSIMSSNRYKNLWQYHQNIIAAYEWLNKQSDLCALGLHGVIWHTTPGTVFLHKKMPLYQDGYSEENKNQKIGEAYNYLIASKNFNVDPEYKLQFCFIHTNDENVCVYKREGLCNPHPNHSVNEFIKIKNMPYKNEE